MSAPESASPAAPSRTSFRDIATDALRYWEWRRLIYNGVLALIVIGYFSAGLPQSLEVVSINGILILFVLAVLANLLYCAAYIVDVFAQFSAFRPTWLRSRWLLLAIGTTFAAVITRFFALGFFSH
jgi:hypothetical protein